MDRRGDVVELSYQVSLEAERCLRVAEHAGSEPVGLGFVVGTGDAQLAECVKNAQGRRFRHCELAGQLAEPDAAGPGREDVDNAESGGDRA